jgi:hypothetical protein
MTMQRYFGTSKEFYVAALSYLDAWNKRNEDLSILSCLLLEKVHTKEHFGNLIVLLPSECEVLIFNHDKFFDEYTYLHGYLSQKCELFSSAIAKIIATGFHIIHI